MTAQLEITYLGGWTGRRMARRRPICDGLPWGTLDLSAHSPAELDEARAVWTNGVFTEYASAAAFSNLATALLESGAPIDLTATAADIVVDEMAHVELVSRLVMELGGAVPYHADLGKISQVTSPEADRPFLRACELAVTTSCVGEALSVPALRRSRSLAGQGLVHRVLDRLVRDEGPHAQLGMWFLEWAAPQLSRGERAWLAGVAMDAIEVYAPLWREAGGVVGGVPALGASDFERYRATMTAAVEDGIVPRLTRSGITVDAARLRAALAPA